MWLENHESRVVNSDPEYAKYDINRYKETIFFHSFLSIFNNELYIT